MKRLNYNHLLYFRAVAKAGSVSSASRQLHLSQPTVSEQLQTFERAIGCKLFLRLGRKLQITPSGKVVLRYADRIFRLADDLARAIDKMTSSANRKRTRRPPSSRGSRPHKHK